MGDRVRPSLHLLGRDRPTERGGGDQDLASAGAGNRGKALTVPSLYFTTEIRATITEEQARWLDEYRSRQSHTPSRKAAVRELLGIALRMVMEGQCPEEKAERERQP